MTTGRCHVRKYVRVVKYMKKQGMILAVLFICVAIASCGKAGDHGGDDPGAARQAAAVEPAASHGGQDCASKKVDGRQIVRQPEKEKKSKPRADVMVRVLDYIPDIKIDLKYASCNNFTGQAVYDFKEAYLRYGTVVKLKKVQERLKRQSCTLLIWDAYRPVSAQYQLWEICPDAAYVANPHKGYSSHSRGNTVDITMLTLEGKKVKMPTEFDDFSEKADRDYSDCTVEERKNAKRLERIMKEEGFTPYSGEWWHFSDTRKYPVNKSIKGIK